MLSLGHKLSLTTQPIYKFVNEHSVDFDGVEERIVTDGADTVAQSTTYSFWCKSSTTTANLGVFGHGNINIGAFHFNENSNRPLLYLGNSFFRYWVDNSAQDDGEWHHWVVYADTNDMTNSKLYIDGVLQTPDLTANTPSTLNTYTESLTIGSDQQSGGNSFEGRIDEFAVYDRELTQAEVTRMFNTYFSQNRIANGNFAQIGNEEVTNGDFSQEGSELVTNGDFALNSNWNGVGSNGWSIDTNTQTLNFTDATSYVFQGIGTVQNKNYKVVLDVELTSGTLIVKSFNSLNIVTINTTGRQTITAYFKEDDTNANFGFIPSGSNVSGKIHSVSVKEVGQDWTILGTNATNTVNFENNGVRFISVDQNISISQLNALTVGKIYKLTCDVVTTTGAIGVDGSIAEEGTITLTNGFNEIYFTASSTTFKIKRIFAVTNCLLSNISLKEVGQHWTIGNGWSVGDKKLLSVNGDNYVTYVGSILTTGKTYKITYEVKDYVSGTFGIRANTVAGITVTANGTYTDTITSNGTTLYLMGFGTFNGSVTNIVVQELKHDATNLMLNAGAYQSANPLITSTKSMEFDGTDDYLQLSEPFSHTNHTITGWFKTDDNTDTQEIFSAADSSDDGIRVFFGNNARLKYRIGDTSSSTITSPTDLDANRWYNFACTYDGTTQIIYIDGVNVVSTTPSKTISTTTNVKIGNKSWSNADYFNGKITEVGAFNRALTALEVASLYNQGMPTNLLVNRNNYQSGNPTVFNTKQVDFDGVDDFLDLGTQSATSSLTYSAWVKLTDNSAGLILQYGKSMIRFGNATTLNWWSDISSAQLNTTISSVEDEWSHIVVTQTGQNAVVYLNGVQVNSSTSQAVVNTASNDSAIGKYVNSNTWHFIGEMSQVGIWDKVLTADEVSSLYNHGLPIDLNTDQAAYASSSNLVGYWRMGSGTLDTYPLIADQTNATLGSELVTNGDFSDGSTGWENAFGGEWVISGGKATLAVGADGSYLRTVSNILTSGKSYKAIITTSGGLDSNNKVTIYATSNTGQKAESDGTHTFYFTADGTSFRFLGAANDRPISIDSVSVKEVQGNPAMMINLGGGADFSNGIQNGSPFANIVQNGTFDTNTDWVAGANITISGGSAIYNNAVPFNNLSQNSIFQTGKTYKVKFSVSNFSGGKLLVQETPNVNPPIETIESNGNYSVTYTATTDSGIVFKVVNGTVNMNLDNVTVEEVNTGLQGYWKMGDGTNDEFPVIYDQTNPTLGSELVTNGNFATDSNWTKGTGWSIGGGVAISDGSSSYSFLQQTSSVLNGKTYKISYSVTSYTSGSVEVGVGSTTNNNIQRNSVGDFVEYHTSNGTNLTIISRNLIGSIDNVSVKEVQGNPATMTNMVEGNITNIHPLTKIRNYYRMGDGILDGYPIIQDQTSPNLAHIPTTNEVTFSEDFTGSFWQRYGTIDASSLVLAPDGTVSAQKLVRASGTYNIIRPVSNITGTYYAISVFVKNIDADNFYLRLEKSGAAEFGFYNFSTNTTSDADIKVEHFANDWIRLSTNVPHNSFKQFGIGENETDSTELNNAVYIWGAQIEAQGQATPYIKSDGIAAVRKSSTTNLVPYSEDFTNSSGWVLTSTYTLTANDIVSPDGTQNATKVAVGTSNGALRTQPITVSPNTSYVFSFFAKRGTASEMKYRVYDFGNGVDVVSKTSYYSQTNTDTWVRIQFTFTTPSNTTAVSPYVDSDSQGNGYFYVWGAQLEKQTQAETYAKTTGLPVTIDLFTENNYGTMTNMSASDIVEDTP